MAGRSTGSDGPLSWPRYCSIIGRLCSAARFSQTRCKAWRSRGNPPTAILRVVAAALRQESSYAKDMVKSLDAFIRKLEGLHEKMKAFLENEAHDSTMAETLEIAKTTMKECLQHPLLLPGRAFRATAGQLR